MIRKFEFGNCHFDRNIAIVRENKWLDIYIVVDNRSAAQTLFTDNRLDRIFRLKNLAFDCLIKLSRHWLMKPDSDSKLNLAFKIDGKV
jgi:hypothetical protein